MLGVLLPPPHQQSCFPYRALSVRGDADRGWHRPHLSNSCIPAPKTPSGTWLLHSGKADPRDPWIPPGQLQACLPTYHAQGLSSGQPPCAMLRHQRRLQWQPHHAAAAPVRKLKAQVYRNLLPRETSLVSLVLAGHWHPGSWPKAMPTSKGRSCF